MMTYILELTSGSSRETQEIGLILGREAKPGDVILLNGELGSGKTTLTQGIAWGLGVGEHAHSPTFVFVGQYFGRIALYHIDLYRIGNVSETHELGLDEYVFGEGLTVVEWANRAPELFPEERIEINLEYIDNEVRRLSFEAYGLGYQRLLVNLAESKGIRGPMRKKL